MNQFSVQAEVDSSGFIRELGELGFTEVLTRDWAPNQFVDTHTHPFDVRALVLQGEVALSCDGRSQTYRSGDVFTLDAGRAHTEQYGPAGANFLVGRKYPG